MRLTFCCRLRDLCLSVRTDTALQQQGSAFSTEAPPAFVLHLSTPAGQLTTRRTIHQSLSFVNQVLSSLPLRGASPPDPDTATGEDKEGDLHIAALLAGQIGVKGHPDGRSTLQSLLEIAIKHNLDRVRPDLYTFLGVGFIDEGTKVKMTKPKEAGGDMPGRGLGDWKAEYGEMNKALSDLQVRACEWSNILCDDVPNTLLLLVFSARSMCSSTRKPPPWPPLSGSSSSSGLRTKLLSSESRPSPSQRRTRQRSRAP